MDFNRNTILDDLTRVIQAIRDDPKLHEWFLKVGHKSAVERRNLIYSMVERMRVECEDAGWVASFQLLANPRVFDAACAVLRENHEYAK
jgi:hypothetical protein